MMAWLAGLARAVLGAGRWLMHRRLRRMLWFTTQTGRTWRLR